MNTGITSFSRSTYDIHQMVMWICVVIGIAVYCAMIYAIITHRKSNRAGVAEIHVSTKMEIFWTLISFLILITLAIPAIQNLLNMEDATRTDLSAVTLPTESIKLNNQSIINISALNITDE